ncbi:hypothetical protein V6Z93_005108 [Aspergillus fumigatus]
MSSCRISINFLLNPQGDGHLGAPAEHPRSREDSRFSQPDPGSERQKENFAGYSPTASNATKKPMNEAPGATSYVCPLNACGLRFSSSRLLSSQYKKAHLISYGEAHGPGQ